MYKLSFLNSNLIQIIYKLYTNSGSNSYVIDIYLMLLISKNIILFMFYILKTNDFSMIMRK